ncbi:MAG: hypothetical protein IPK39_18960 [Sulfuritalea sp.]|nr:hypothetical protein [Sulfuritalea sp.]
MGVILMDERLSATADAQNREDGRTECEPAPFGSVDNLVLEGLARYGASLLQ